MAIQVEGFVWLDWVVEKIITKHAVTPEEAEDAFLDPTCKLRRADAGKYRLYGRSVDGRYLVVIFAWEARRARIITARDMDNEERRHYGRK